MEVLSKVCWQNIIMKEGLVVLRVLKKHFRIHQCCNAKNILSRATGYTPEILVLGRSSRVPGSVVKELRVLNYTNNCKPSLKLTVTKPCAVLYFEGWDHIAVIMHPARTSWRQSQWCGPGRVIHREDQHVVWISHWRKIFRIAPEHVRLLSEREIQSSWKVVQEPIPIDLPQRSGHGVFQYDDLITPNTRETLLPEPTSSNSENNGSTSGPEEPDAEPDHSQTENGSIPEVPATPTIPEDSSDHALTCEDYWVIQKNRNYQCLSKPRKAVFRPLDI